MHEPRQGKAVLLLMAGFAIWGAAFIQLYATQAVGCALGWNGIDVAGPLTLQRALLVVSFLGWIAFVLFTGGSPKCSRYTEGRNSYHPRSE